MKRFMKGCAIAALIFFLLGIGVVTAVLALIDREEVSKAVWELTNGKVELRLNSWTDFGVHINGKWLGSLGMNVEDMFDEDYEVWDGEVEKTGINEDEIEELDIRISGSLLVIRDSSDAFFYIEKSGEGKSQAYEENGVLYVKAMQNSSVLGMQKENKVILYVPENIDLHMINVDLGAGEIEWNALKADAIKVELGAGNFVAKNVVVGDLEVSLGAGECLIQGNLQGDVKVDCAAGSVTLKHAGAEEEFNYEIDCAVGSAQIGKESFSGLASSKNIDNDASKTMEISVSAGSVEVEFE